MSAIKTQCQGTESEFTVVRKLNQGTLRQRDVIPRLTGWAGLAGPFLVPFWANKKEHSKSLKCF